MCSDLESQLVAFVQQIHAIFYNTFSRLTLFSWTMQDKDVKQLHLRLQLCECFPPFELLDSAFYPDIFINEGSLKDVDARINVRKFNSINNVSFGKHYFSNLE